MINSDVGKMSANRKTKNPLKLLGGVFRAYIMVGRARLELATPGLKVRRSAN